MLHSLFSIKIAAMASALGLNTAEWTNPSKEMETQVKNLESAIAKITDASKADEVQSSINNAIAAIKDLADKGDKDAQYSMGLLSQQGGNQQGGNQQQAVEQAMKYYEMAAKQGQLQAMNNYGFMLAATSQDAEKAKEGLGWIKKASDQGLNGARRNMAQVYLRGLGGEKQDINAAEQLLLKAAEDKDGQAAFELSELYSSPAVKDKQSYSKALEWLKKSAEYGNANGLDTMGTLLIQGGKLGDIEIKADPKTAVDTFQKLADQNNPVGLRKMGGIYESGLAEVKPDFKKSMEYYTQAAQRNDALAQFRLASMYDTGLDVDPKDDKVEVQPNAAAALNLFRAAAQNGMSLANFYVGLYYEAGRTVDRDLQKAFAFFQQAAQQGVIPAMQKVGVYYINGAGTIKDPVASVGWFARTAAAGLPDGLLNYGIVCELGLVPATEKGSPYLAAADAYLDAANSPMAADAVRIEAYLRVGNIYYRGLAVGKDETPKPDLEKAFIYFQQAVDIDPKNPNAELARSEVRKQLTVDQIKKAEADIAKLKAEFEKRQKSAQGAAAPAAAAPAAEAKEAEKK